RASVKGAKVVHREGYRFRPAAGDKLGDPDAWTASSHRGLRLPPKNPAALKLEPFATVGVVLHLADVQADAELTVELTGPEKAKALIQLKDVLAGKSASILDDRGVIRLISTATPVVIGPTEDDFPAACYGPDGTLWVAYIGYHLKDESRRVEQQPLREQP